MERDLRLYIYEGVALKKVTGKRIVGRYGFKNVRKDNHQHTCMKDAIAAMDYIRGIKSMYMLNAQFVLIEFTDKYKSRIIWVS